MTYPKKNFAPRKFTPQRSYAPPPPTPAPKPPAPREALQVQGDPNLWKTLQRVTDPASGWTKTTRAMQIPGGVLINTCSRKKDSTVAAEALCLCPGAKLTKGADQLWVLA